MAYNPRRFCPPPESPLNTQQEVLALLDEILSLKGRTTGFSADTPLLGAIPELDSMAVVALITGMEERFGFMTDDDEIDGSVFATVGSLVGFVESKLAG
jgi:acyl carrier protein